MSKRKKGHGGLKFLASLVVIGAFITALVAFGKSELGQRITGNREDRRLERTTPAPRFAYTASTLRVTEGSMYNEGGTPVDLTTTSDISIDRPSETASVDVNIVRTPADPTSSATEVPPTDVRAAYSEILTMTHRYESPVRDTEPWFRWANDRQLYSTPLDLHYIPMIDDLVGFELRDLPTVPLEVAPASEIKTVASPSGAGSPSVPPTVTTVLSYTFDVATFNRAVPILAGRVGFVVPGTTVVTLTIGFDDVGLLRFADISIPNMAATEQARLMGAGRDATYHYTFEVTDVAGEPIDIDVPSNFVDAGPDALSAAIP